MGKKGKGNKKAAATPKVAPKVAPKVVPPAATVLPEARAAHQVQETSNPTMQELRKQLEAAIACGDMEAFSRITAQMMNAAPHRAPPPANVLSETSAEHLLLTELKGNLELAVSRQNNTEIILIIAQISSQFSEDASVTPFLHQQLLVAVGTGNIDSVTAFGSANPLEIKDENGRGAIFYAQTSQMLNYLCAYEPHNEAFFAKDRAGDTPLHVAAFQASQGNPDPLNAILTR